MSQKIEIKFEDKSYRAEIPELPNFTGQLMLLFHLKLGNLMKVDISKSSSGIIMQDLSTIEAIEKNVE